jgi:hypothetical protein
MSLDEFVRWETLASSQQPVEQGGGGGENERKRAPRLFPNPANSKTKINTLDTSLNECATVSRPDPNKAGLRVRSFLLMPNIM